MISDERFNRIRDNLPRVGIRGYCDADQQRRMGLAFCAIELLTRMTTHCRWGISYPDMDALALAQDGLINVDAGPTETCLLIYRLLNACMFFDNGVADWRVLALLNRAGFITIRNFDDVDSDAYWVRTLRGHFVVFPPNEGV